MIWTGSATAAWAGCSPGYGPLRRRARSCGSFTLGHVRQLDAVAARLLAGLADCTPVLAGADELAYIDVDDTVRQTYGYAKQTSHGEIVSSGGGVGGVV